MQAGLLSEQLRTALQSVQVGLAGSVCGESKPHALYWDWPYMACVVSLTRLYFFCKNTDSATLRAGLQDAGVHHNARGDQELHQPWWVGRLAPLCLGQGRRVGVVAAVAKRRGVAFWQPPGFWPPALCCGNLLGLYNVGRGKLLSLPYTHPHPRSGLDQVLRPPAHVHQPVMLQSLAHALHPPLCPHPHPRPHPRSGLDQVLRPPAHLHQPVVLREPPPGSRALRHAVRCAARRQVQ